jgi:AraC-like DNA-binding protein
MTARDSVATADRSLDIWEVEPAPALRGIVAGPYQGYRQVEPPLAVRREVPCLIAPLIIPFGRELEVAAAASPRDFSPYEGGFVASLTDSYAVVRWNGVSCGIQLNLTPIAARLIFGLPLSEVGGRILSLETVFGAEGSALAESVRDAGDWQRRGDVLDAFILRRLGRAQSPPPGIVWAWRRLIETGGAEPASSLARRLDWSPRRLIDAFRGYIGLGPKTAARVVRFDRLKRRLQRSTPSLWAAIAIDCGYYDQSHLRRDVLQFTGLTPREYLASLLSNDTTPH